MVTNQNAVEFVRAIEAFIEAKFNEMTFIDRPDPVFQRRDLMKIMSIISSGTQTIKNGNDTPSWTSCTDDPVSPEEMS